MHTVKPWALSRSLSFLGLTLSLVFFSMSFISCTQKNGGTSSQSSSQGSGTSQNAKTAEARVVNLAIWSNYIQPSVIAEFEKKTGIQVHISNYSSNEELLAKLQAGASGYDVVVPSDYMVYAMIKLGMLHPLDFNLLTHSKSIDPKFLHKGYDPQNKYSIPYNWGTTGIAVNRALYSGEIKGWKDLLGKEDLAGKFSLLDDAREVLGAGLKSQGYSLNSKNPEELQKSKELLMKVRKRVKSFSSEPMMPLVNGETSVAHVFMSDALQARKLTGGKIEYLIPEEGGTFWVDSLVIPSSALHVQEAYALIDHLMGGPANAATVMAIWVAPTSLETFGLLPKEVQKDSMLFPSPGALSKCEMLQDLGEFLSVWDRAWTEIKAGK